MSEGHLGETHPKGKGSLLSNNKAKAVMEGYIVSSVLGLCIQPGYPLTRLRSISERALGKVLLINSQGSAQRDNTASPCSNVGKEEICQVSSGDWICFVSPSRNQGEAGQCSGGLLTWVAAEGPCHGQGSHSGVSIASLAAH